MLPSTYRSIYALPRWSLKSKIICQMSKHQSAVGRMSESKSQSTMATGAMSPTSPYAVSTIRCYSSSSLRSSQRSSSQQPTVFNSSMKRTMRDNSARLADSRSYDYLRTEVSSRLVDRLDDVKREFPLALDLGAGSCTLHREICR